MSFLLYLLLGYFFFITRASVFNQTEALVLFLFKFLAGDLFRTRKFEVCFEVQGIWIVMEKSVGVVDGVDSKSCYMQKFRLYETRSVIIILFYSHHSCLHYLDLKDVNFLFLFLLCYYVSKVMFCLCLFLVKFMFMCFVCSHRIFIVHEIFSIEQRRHWFFVLFNMNGFWVGI